VEEKPAYLKRKNYIAGQAVSEGGMVIIAFTYSKPAVTNGKGVDERLQLEHWC
jgi:hypothetical protein